jgi:hypothetical protein
VAADQGCVGLFLYLGVLGFAFGTSWKRLKEEPPGVSVVGWALWAGALGFAVQAAFGKAPMYWSFSGPMWLLLGVLASARGWPGPDDDPGDEAASEAQSHCSPVAAAALLVVCAGTAFLWWDWGLRPYASAVEMGRAQWLQKHMHDPEHGPAMFEEFRAHIRHARSRCLWADEILHADYVTGWYLTTHREWAEGARVLEKVQELAPEFLRTRLFLAECYFGLRRPQEARRELGEYMARDPHDLAAYRLMSYVDGRAAAEALLSPHVMSRLEQQPNWIVEDHPTGDEVRMLLDLQVRLGKLEEARRSFLSAREFFARAQLSRQVNVDAEVRKLARTYTDEGEEHLASAVRRLMPEAFARGGSGRGQS